MLLALTSLVFLVLKLSHVVAWSWWWVTSPLIALVVIRVLGYAIVGGIAISQFRKAGLLK
jgi:hypothetical protein